MRLKRDAVLPIGTILALASPCSADVIWPAIYVIDSYYRFWYLVTVTILVEAVVVFYWIKCSLRKAFVISIVANLFSSTIGLFLFVYGMLFWHLIVDRFVDGTFNLFNKIATLLILFLLSGLLEAIIVRIIWKYRIKQTIMCMLVGNLISYLVIAFDLFVYGGWGRYLG